MAADAYARITDRIIESLERGTVPWRKPWRGGESGFPKNLISKRAYRGVNVFLLSCTPYESPYWLTYRQAKELGGYVRKGEKSTPVVFWKWLERKVPESEEPERFPLLRYYNLFNAAQCDLPSGVVAEIAAEPDSAFEPIAECERIVSEMPARPAIRIGGAAFYRPTDDTVYLPERERFDRAEEYYSTLFHELTHATGHASRLNRPSVTEAAPFGSPTYGREELIAEMGAAFLCGHAGIETATVENSAAYINGWLSKLRSDKRLVVHAAAAAQKAADFILNRSYVPDDPAT